jgi:exopolysaccharide biosynthesis polyprenyl glycosylphosphotransferase
MWNIRRSSNSRFVEGNSLITGCGVASEECFGQFLHIEQKRTERSGKSLVLMLLEFDSALTTQGTAIEKILFALTHLTRETDVKGWYKNRSVLGVIFTDVASGEAESIAAALVTKVRGLLVAAVPERESQIRLVTRVFPQDWRKGGPDQPGSELPVELRGENGGRKVAAGVKRSMDVIGSLLAIVIFSPLFAAIALAIKLTSKGPVLFRQQRVGQYGQTFEFLKFRSMHTGNNHAVHQEFVKELIAGSVASRNDSEQQKPVYKLTNDPRITPIGKFLRRTSLDEMPQFVNVLKGQMSLVGPRPPIPYEVECYESWHRRRLSAVKPGITGLWQVKGRSRTTFDEMVRLDLQYARKWSVWMDICILVETPRAMLSGEGAH